MKYPNERMDVIKSISQSHTDYDFSVFPSRIQTMTAVFPNNKDYDSSVCFRVAYRLLLLCFPITYRL
jgi:hypothetical protein